MLLALKAHAVLGGLWRLSLCVDRGEGPKLGPHTINYQHLVFAGSHNIALYRNGEPSSNMILIGYGMVHTFPLARSLVACMP